MTCKTKLRYVYMVVSGADIVSNAPGAAEGVDGEDPDGVLVDGETPGGETGAETGEESSRGLSPAVIGGAAAGAMLLLLGIGCFVWGRRKRSPSPAVVRPFFVYKAPRSKITVFGFSIHMPRLPSLLLSLKLRNLSVQAVPRWSVSLVSLTHWLDRFSAVSILPVRCCANSHVRAAESECGVPSPGDT